MRTDHPDRLSDVAAVQQPPARKPYVKPAFRHERVFETMALSCGKIQITQDQCHRNRRNS